MLGFNYLFINGCQANSTVSDDNPLVKNIGQELRLNQKDNTVTFPGCMNDLSKRFPAGAVTHTSTVYPIINFVDKYFKILNIIPD